MEASERRTLPKQAHQASRRQQSIEHSHGRNVPTTSHNGDCPRARPHDIGETADIARVPQTCHRVAGFGGGHTRAPQIRHVEGASRQEELPVAHRVRRRERANRGEGSGRGEPFAVRGKQQTLRDGRGKRSGGGRQSHQTTRTAARTDPRERSPCAQNPDGLHASQAARTTPRPSCVVQDESRVLCHRQDPSSHLLRHLALPQTRPLSLEPREPSWEARLLEPDPNTAVPRRPSPDPVAGAKEECRGAPAAKGEGHRASGQPREHAQAKGARRARRRLRGPRHRNRRRRSRTHHPPPKQPTGRTRAALGSSIRKMHCVMHSGSGALQSRVRRRERAVGQLGIHTRTLPSRVEKPPDGVQKGSGRGFCPGTRRRSRF